MLRPLLLLLCLLATVVLGTESETATVTALDTNTNDTITETFSFSVTEEGDSNSTESAAAVPAADDGEGLSFVGYVLVFLGIAIFLAGSCVCVYTQSGSMYFTDRMATYTVIKKQRKQKPSME